MFLDCRRTIWGSCTLSQQERNALKVKRNKNNERYSQKSFGANVYTVRAQLTRCLQIQSCRHSGLTEKYIYIYIYTAQNFHISLQNVANGYEKEKVGWARRVTCPFSMVRSPSWPGQLFSIQKLISACPAWSTRSRRFNPRLVSSVGRAPVCWAGGHRFKPPPDQHSGSLNIWQESAAFVLWHLQMVRLSSLLG